MPHYITGPSIVPGVEPKLIEEFVGGVNTGSTDMSVARMVAPAGWTEHGQRPEFDEVTLVLAGAVRVETEGETFRVDAGQAIKVTAGEWVRYSTPGDTGATYIAICTPAFTPDTVNRD
jgi:mannose-6-phosphate isomerase-like protein (cupin superfamily)